MYAGREMAKTKEQLAEDKEVALSMRIKPLNIDGFTIDDLKGKAEQFWERIVQLESEKYDLEERQKRQEYDVSSAVSILIYHFYSKPQFSPNSPGMYF